jgi:HPt (histidine-containing phosphotransfer) domain-containing protein
MMKSIENSNLNPSHSSTHIDTIGVMKAAHRIKGSASYLCCECLKDISLKLQDAGHEGTVNPSPEILATIEVLFMQFVTALEALKAEIATGMYDAFVKYLVVYLSYVLCTI